METLTNDLIKIIRKYRPTREQLQYAIANAKQNDKVREILGHVQKRKPKKIPDLPNKTEIQAFLKALEDDKKLKYRLMVKLYIYTGLRCAELLNVKVEHVDLEQNRIRVEQGKGKKDRIVPFWSGLRDLILMYLSTIPRNKYLFENKFGNRYSERWIRELFIQYCKKAEIKRVHPHVMRHYCLTHLRKQGIPLENIKIISGHAFTKNLEIYDHLSLADVEKEYQQAMDKMGI